MRPEREVALKVLKRKVLESRAGRSGRIPVDGDDHTVRDSIAGVRLGRFESAIAANVKIVRFFLIYADA